MAIDTSNNTIITTNALLYKTQNGELTFLLVQENDNNWGLPGGAKEVEDVDLLITLKRELKEELGLEESDYVVQETSVRREFEYNHFRSSRFGKHGIVLFYAVKIVDPSRVKASDELVQVAWFEKDEAAQKLTFDHIRDGFKETSSLVSNPHVSS